MVWIDCAFDGHARATGSDVGTIAVDKLNDDAVVARIKLEIKRVFSTCYRCIFMQFILVTVVSSIAGKFGLSAQVLSAVLLPEGIGCKMNIGRRWWILHLYINRQWDVHEVFTGQ